MIGLVLFLVLVFGMAVWLWAAWGLKGYIQAVLRINALHEPQKTQVSQDFYGVEGEYKGILAKIDVGMNGGVWIWRNFKLEHFPTDDNTIYSFFHACDNLKILVGRDGETKQIPREVTKDINIWSREVTPGDFIQLFYPGQGATTDPRVAKEAYAYDWKVYQPLGNQCAN